MSNWIDVKKELPQKDALYLIHAPSADEDKPLIQTAWYNPESGWSLMLDYWIPFITHWMPMPAPPKEIPNPSQPQNHPKEVIMDFTRMQLLIELAKSRTLPVEAQEEVALHVKKKLMEEPQARSYPRAATEVSRSASENVCPICGCEVSDIGEHTTTNECIEALINLVGKLQTALRLAAGELSAYRDTNKHPQEVYEGILAEAD